MTRYLYNIFFYLIIWAFSSNVYAANYFLEFDGSNDYLVTGTNLPTGDFTYSMWVNFGSGIGGRALFSSNNNEIFLHRSTTGTTHLILNEADQNNADLDYASWTDSGWNHLALTRSGNSISLYKNGSSVDTGSDGATLNFDGCGLYIGTDEDDADGTDNTCTASLGNFLDGDLDEFAVWDEALTANEISALYNSGEPLSANSNSGNYTSSSNLVGYWKMDDGTGSSVSDSSSQSNNATINGATWREFSSSISETARTVSEGSTATYTIALTQEPMDDVTVSISSGDTSAATVTASLTFTPANYNTAQTVTITGVEDSDNINETFNITHSASGGGYSTVTFPNVAVTMDDNEDAGLVASSVPSNAKFCSATSTPMVIAPDLSIPNGATSYDGAYVVIESGFTSGDTLAMQTGYSLPSGATSSFSTDTGILTISATDISRADLQAVLRKVEFNSTDTSSSSRTITIVLGDKLQADFNDHFYEYVESDGISWTNARTAASNRSYFGLTGYLATIISSEENNYIKDKIRRTDNTTPEGWLGASDATTEGTWKWVTGPEQTGSNSHFWTGTASGSAAGGNFSDWELNNGLQPDNAQGDEHYLMFHPSGKWNDYPDTRNSSMIDGYIVEFSEGDWQDGEVLEQNLSASTTISVRNCAVTVSHSARTVNEGGTATYTVALTQEPSSDVTITITSADTSAATVTASLTFTSSNYSTAQTVTITGLEDSDNTNETFNITHAISGGGYDGVSVANVVVTMDDNEDAGLDESSVPSSLDFDCTTSELPLAPNLNIPNGASSYDGAFVVIESGLNAGDVLQMQSGYTLPAGVSTSYSSTTGILTITASNISRANLQAVLRKVEFDTTDTSSSSRTVNIVLGDKLRFSGNNHFYEYVAFDTSLASPSSGRSWTGARDSAADMEYFGLTGYLATITGSSENNYLLEKITANAWIGASDEDTEGTWLWKTGPEAGNSISGYTNWNSGEPNNSGGNEDYAHMMSWQTPPGVWNDLPNNGGSGNYKATGYLVEYSEGWQDGEVLEQNLSDAITINVGAAPAPTVSAPFITAGDASTVSYDITYTCFTNAEITLTSSDITLIPASALSATVGIATDTDTTDSVKTVNFSNLDGSGDLSFTVDAGSANDGVYNALGSAESEKVRRGCFDIKAVTFNHNGNYMNETTAAEACVLYH